MVKIFDFIKNISKSMSLREFLKTILTCTIPFIGHSTREVALLFRPFMVCIFVLSHIS